MTKIQVDEETVQDTARNLNEFFDDGEIDALDAIAAMMLLTRLLARRTNVDPEEVLDWAVRRLDTEEE